MNKCYGFKWLDFVSGNNVVEVRNEQDFEIFKLFLDKHSLLGILKDYLEFIDWQKIAAINNKPTDIFLFEYSNFKGITWSSDRDTVIDWYGAEPLSVDDLFAEEEFVPTVNYLKQQKFLSNLSIAQVVAVCENFKSYVYDAYIPNSLKEILDKAKTDVPCPHCGNDLYVSDLPQYDYVCPDCDENF